MYEKKRILIYRWKAYNYTDVLMAFAKLGFVCDVIEKKLDKYEDNPEFEMLLNDRLNKNIYDFVFTINYFASVSVECQKHNVPYIYWNCDSPLIAMQHNSVFNSCNVGFTFDKADVFEMNAMGVKQYYHMPLAINNERLDALLEGFKEDIKYEDEVSFVGSLYEKNSYDKMVPSMPDYLKGYLDACMEAQINISGGNILSRLLTVDVIDMIEKNFVLDKSDGSFSNLQIIFANTVLGFKTAQKMRKRYLIELSKHVPVTVYTGSDTSELISVNCKPVVDYKMTMPFVFRESKINLNFTIPNIQTGIPLRVWDVLGAGGFLLTNHQYEIDEIFEDGKDLVCFEDERDLVAKARYYLEHDDERKAIARSGYLKAKKHDNADRLKQMLKKAEEVLEERNA
ncbi:MAG: DUF3880 domain-containing protein [Lachnospiraceae bacterium]|nr:DUF3880 domain-containing protein [Lachnospiraceae bacterium]